MPVAQAAQEPVEVTPEAYVADVNRWDALLQQYFGADWRTAKKVMRCESGGNPRAHNGNARTGDDSWGLFQINRFGRLATTRPAPDQLVDPEINIRYAAGMHRAQGWKPWSCARKIGIA